MGVLIDETNYNLYLKQSTTPRGSTPDGNIYFDVANDLIQLIGVDELATFDHTSMGGGASDANQLTNFDGITMRGLYNFDNQERSTDETLRNFKKGISGSYRFAGAFNFTSGVKLDDTALVDLSVDRNKIRGSGWIEYADIGLGASYVDRIYHGVLSLVDVQATTIPYQSLVTATDEATLQAATWSPFVREGDINEAVQVFGDTTYDAGAGDFDYTTRNLVVRVRSWQYNPGETTSALTGITEFSGFSAGYGIGETANPANTFTLADVYGGAQVTPWTGMSLVKAVATTKSGFNEADGDFTWVLNNTLAGTAQQCAAFLDALTLQATSVDDGVGDYFGDKGRVWYSRDAAGKIVSASIGGEGLFIDGLSVAEKQNVILTDDAALQKTYPFFPELSLTVGDAAQADANAWYHIIYVDGDALLDYDTAAAVTVEDSSATPMKGLCSEAAAGVISMAYAYDTNTQAGLTAASDKAMVAIVESYGSGSVNQAITYFTMKRETTISVACSPSADLNA
jgi:hypothetical protein